MRRIELLSALAGAVLLAGAVAAAPLQVRTYGSKSQQVVMCPDCKEKIACAKVGDYSVGFDADVENTKTGAARVAVHVKDKAGKPVDDAAVTVTLTMPKHAHGKKPLELKSAGHGRYETATILGMAGGWKADVQVKPATGDTVTQAFSFAR